MGPGNTAYSEHIENRRQLDKRNFARWEGVIGFVNAGLKLWG
jgi:hypothetical protein